jgi:ribonuclease HI
LRTSPQLALSRPVPNDRALLTPEEVLRRYSSGPQHGVFTDGSCAGNPGPGGWGVVWVEDGEIRAEKSGRDPATTNNRMELTALIAAYEMLPEDAEITVYSDSQLCVRTVNEWAEGWARRGWRRKSGPIANLELVQRLYALAGAHPKVTLAWIRAHDGSKWNEYADALANAFMREA